MLQFVSEVIV